jgi:hypothetical protein
MKPRGAKRVDRSRAPGLVVDAGALRALEAHHVGLLVALRAAHRLKLPIFVPAGALAQVWRGGPRSASLARLLKQPVTVVQVDELVARQIGEFLAGLRLPKDVRADVVDAHVALTTRATQSLVWTSDPMDMTRYGVAPSHIRPI